VSVRRDVARVRAAEWESCSTWVLAKVAAHAFGEVPVSTPPKCTPALAPEAGTSICLANRGARRHCRRRARESGDSQWHYCGKPAVRTIIDPWSRPCQFQVCQPPAHGQACPSISPRPTKAVLRSCLIERLN